MQPIVSGKFVKSLDKAFIQAKNLTSFQLMERAAQGFCYWFLKKFETRKIVHVFCGTGNNGGDGLAIARILHQAGMQVIVYTFDRSGERSDDYSLNYERLPKEISIVNIQPSMELHFLNEIIIDGLFGVGLNRPLSGLYEDVVRRINQSNSTIVSVDIPSGLPSDDILAGIAVKATYTVTFQFPKLSLLFPDHAAYVGDIEVVDIGIENEFFQSYPTFYYWLRGIDLSGFHRKFHRFSHKGDFGRVLLIGGSEGKMGSIALTTLAALRTGSGLVSACVPACGVSILQSITPEAMVQINSGKNQLKLPVYIEDFDALGIGPGLGISPQSLELVTYIVQNFTKGIVIDADAINIIAENKPLLNYLQNCVLTPHLKEFERLVGTSKDHLDRLCKAREFCIKYQCFLVLKGANSVVTLPDGRQIFNSSGNQYMATGGSGDALTGIITSFLGQGYSPGNAAICGVYHHGLAGELASRDRLRGTIASDIISKIPESFKVLDIT